MKNLRETLINIARKEISDSDPSHDFSHAMRVLRLAEYIGEKEKTDLDVIVPAALFHDIVVYPKNDPRTQESQDESAKKAHELLEKIELYPKEKIETVAHIIRTCSFSKSIHSDLLEARIIQDADGLEATGAISIMRTFSSSGSMARSFYHENDPFCRKRKPEDKRYALDLFFTRLLKIKDSMHTPTAKKMAERRTLFLRKFLKQLELELRGGG